MFEVGEDRSKNFLNFEARRLNADRPRPSVLDVAKHLYGIPGIPLILTTSLLVECIVFNWEK